MKTILIIEDDEFKAKSLRDFMQARDSTSSIFVVSSLVEAISAINSSEYDYVLIDMAIPSHPLKVGEGAPISLLTGGLEVLLELQSLERSDPCIIITQYPDIEISGQFFPLDKASEEIKSQLGCSVLTCVEYRESDPKWKKQLGTTLDNNENSIT